MDWSNEDYVRAYTRDTADLMAIGPEGRLLWWELLRKADKSGVIDHGGDLDVLPDLLRVPFAWWSMAFPRLLKRGMVLDNGKALVIPNYVLAQTTAKSDKQRQRESRERRKNDALAMLASDASASQNVTGSHDESRGVTKCHPTLRDATLRDASLRNAIPRPLDELENASQPTLELPNLPQTKLTISRERLEKVYLGYPKKTGKAKGLDKCQHVIKTEEQFLRFQQCVDWMAKAWAGHDPHFCPGFEPFANGRRWEDDDWPAPGAARKGDQKAMTMDEVMAFQTGSKKQ